jgi:hypothetical protein
MRNQIIDQIKKNYIKIYGEKFIQINNAKREGEWE